MKDGIAEGREIEKLNRRGLIRMSVAGVAATLMGSGAPLWARDPEAGIQPLQTEFVFEALVTIDPAVEIGPSARGTRRYIPITGGTFHGPKIKGVVLAGGADWQLERPDGVLELDALYSIKTDDNAVIIVHNRGIAAKGSALRTVPQFEAPIGRHDWLNKAVFVGSVDGAPQPGAVVIRVFRVL